MSGVHWGIAGSVSTQGPVGCRSHQGALGAPRDVRGYWGCQGRLGKSGGVVVSGGIGGLAGSVGTQASRGIGAWGCRGCEGALGSIGGCRGCTGGGRCTGRMTTLGPVQGHSTPTGSPWGVTYLTKARQGPLLRVPSLPLVSLGE